MPDRVRRTAVIDLGSNSFRLVVFSDRPGAWWRRSDEIYEAVRIGAGMTASGELQPEATDRALHTIEHYAHFCRASGLTASDIRVVATSAIREATNRAEFLERAEQISGLQIRVLSREDEARYGYLAAINSTTLERGCVLDLGGGSLQLVDVSDRQAVAMDSWRLGAIRMTERFLAAEDPPSKKALRDLRDHVARKLDSAQWLMENGERLVGVGGTVRNLAAAAEFEARLPSWGVQGFVMTRAALDTLVDQLAALPASERGRLPGIKPERGDVILAGAIVVQSAMEAGGFATLEATEAGLREGIFFEQHLTATDPPLFPNVREASVRNLAAQYHSDPPHVSHVARLALQMFDALAAGGLHPGDHAERELVWAAAMLHDIGVTVDYDDHHKHSRYLILNAGLPGFTPREVALIGQMARYHRRGSPRLGTLAPLMADGDEQVLARGAALLRIAEQIERSRDQLVREAKVEIRVGKANAKAPVELTLVADEDVSVARWAAAGQVDIFEAAFGRSLTIT